MHVRHLYIASPGLQLAYFVCIQAGQKVHAPQQAEGAEVCEALQSTNGISNATIKRSISGASRLQAIRERTGSEHKS